MIVPRATSWVCSHGDIFGHLQTQSVSEISRWVAQLVASFNRNLYFSGISDWSLERSRSQKCIDRCARKSNHFLSPLFSSYPPIWSEHRLRQELYENWKILRQSFTSSSSPSTTLHTLLQEVIIGRSVVLLLVPILLF